VISRLEAPFNPELAVGAFMPEWTWFLKAGTAEVLQLSQAEE
jgi:hypothetical protein